jgi:hypothetical protein
MAAIIINTFRLNRLHDLRSSNNVNMAAIMINKFRLNRLHDLE